MCSFAFLRYGHAYSQLERAQDGPEGGGVVAPGQVLFCIGNVFFFFMNACASLFSDLYSSI